MTEPGHTTTARDLGVLSSRLMHDFPEYMSYGAIRVITSGTLPMLLNDAE